MIFEIFTVRYGAIWVVVFSFFLSLRIYTVAIHKNCLAKAGLIRGHNISL